MTFDPVQTDPIKSDCRRRSKVDLSGQRFGKLVANRWMSTGDGVKRAGWVCLCDCGKETFVYTRHLNSGNTRSCGCVAPAKARARVKAHGLVNSKIYEVYHSMRQRCNNPQSQMFHNYGGRGIKVCPRWEESFENFLEDMGIPPEGYHIDRINNDLGYSPENCKWVTPKQNARNKRTNVMLTHNGETHCIKEWAEITGIPFERLYKRARLGMPVERIFDPSKLVPKRVSDAK